MALVARQKELLAGNINSASLEKRNLFGRGQIFRSSFAACVAISAVLAPVIGDELTVRAQSYISKLGYDAGVVDGRYGQKTAADLTAAFAENGGQYSGKLSEEDVEFLRDLVLRRGISPLPAAGYEAENFSEEMKLPPDAPGVTRSRYAYGHYWVNTDWNGDGLRDFLYTGTMVAENSRPNGVNTGDACGRQTCKGAMPGPTLYLAQTDGTYLETNGLFVDDRTSAGQSLARQNLVADFNGDGVSDLYIADHGLGTFEGFRDSYFLSQLEGVWLESSETHLSHPNFKSFSHGAAVGDINNNGTMDVVLTDLQGRLNCLMNDGTGRLSKRSCGDIFAFGIELGDIDGDGSLDVVFGAHEYEGIRTGGALNDGTGIFRKAWTLPSVDGWGTVPEVAVWDLNEDGKQDIVLSRAGVLYAGTAIEVLENLGEGKFRSQFFPIVELPAGYDATAEANEWNNFVHSVRFSDVDLDGRTDILLIANGRGPHAAQIHGSILRNSGNMTFEHVRNRSAGNPVQIIEESRFLDDLTLILSRLEPARGAPTDTSASRAFQSAIKGREVPDSDMASYVDILDPILLPESGAAIVGVKDFQVSQGRGSFELLIKWGGKVLPVEVCVESYLANKFTGYRVRFSESGFGGLSTFDQLGTHSCMGQPGYAGDWELAPEGERTGIRALLRDISSHGKSIIVGLPVLSDHEKVYVISSPY